MPNRVLSLLTGGLLLLVPAAAQAANVTVHVEGATATLVAPTAIATGTGSVVKDGDASHSCSGTSAAGALEKATNGAWTGTWFDGLGYAIDSVLGEAHAYAGGAYWTTYLNGKYASSGICDLELQTGDEVLFFPTCADRSAPSGCYLDPLDVSAPATVAPGQPLSVSVNETTTTTDENYVSTSTVGPSAAATVAAGGSSASTDANGTATLTLTQRGATQVRVTKGALAPDEATVCVTDGADGYCGTKTPEGTTLEPAPTVAAGPCTSNGHDGYCGSSDRTAAVGRILGLSDHQTFAAGKGPRTLSGSIADDPSGIKDVRIRLTRNDGGRCFAYDGASEQFKRTRTCRAKNARFFSVGDRQQWSYLLPARLKRGRYVLDVLTVDKAGNVDHLVRNRSRVVFRVA